MNLLTKRFVMRQGPTPGLLIELSKSGLTIGRDLSNDIVINDVEISRRHARLTLQGDRYLVEDTGSTNGTFVNGQRLSAPHVLVAGDVVNLGENVSLVYESTVFDPAATQVSSSAEATALPVQPFVPEPAPAVKPMARPTPLPTPPPAVYTPAPKIPEYESLAPAQYSGQVPAGPVEVSTPAARPKKPANQWLLAGCGCLLVVLCLLVALLVFIDQPWAETGLYCTTPFDIVFRWFGYCP